MQQIDNFCRQPLQLVIEIVRQKIDALVRALHPRPDFGKMRRLLVPQLIQLGPDLAQQLLQLLFQRRTPLEMVDDLEENEKDRCQRRRIDQPGGKMGRVGRRNLLGQEGHQQQGKRVAKIRNHGRMGDGDGLEHIGGIDGADVGPKNFTALGGKVRSAGPGVETEEGVGVEVGDDAAKLLTLGVGETDKDAVLQPVKTEIDRLQAASQQIVLEILDIVGSLGRGGVKTPGLGLVKKIIDELNELAAGLGNFGNHGCLGSRHRLDGGFFTSQALLPFP